jgi:hypothetical protein
MTKNQGGEKTMKRRKAFKHIIGAATILFVATAGH